MKTLRIALLAVFTLFFVNANAQILRNSFLVGGSMNFDYNDGKTTQEINGSTKTTTDPTSTVFGISPRFGYFLADNFCLGLNLDFRINSTSTSGQTSTTTRLITGPFARYYFPFSDNVYGFGEFSFGGGIDSRTVSTGYDSAANREITSNVAVTNLQLGVGPGINFFLNDYIAFEALAKYTYGRSTYNYTDNIRGQINNTTIGNNISFTLGLQVYFRAITSGIKE